ncbi:glycogen synthase (ADP-glucose) [Aminomonas paucivorans DSM 12260]|uniref:Glycogen synthase n=2 Tax=Aminomonas TaxID=81411 RepID=E3CVL1_9BACT|nr:glycogen synthase [Aminomonas paucivorans]EFQ24202.1 glycogen synthase (ADP-glucose) [Aminomonas paucivorans DSM 12260]
MEATNRPPRSRVLHVTPELAPLVKLGGLGDVAGSLPRALREDGVDCRALLPAYPGVLDRVHDLGLPCRRVPQNLHVALNWRVYSGRLWRTDLDGVPVYLLEQPELFTDPQVYPGSMTCETVLPFLFLGAAALELAGAARWKPQILHLHDWPASTASVLLKWHRHYHRLAEEYDTVLTIHNLAHQGIVAHTGLDGWGFPKTCFSIEGLEFYGHVNLLKGGILAADAITTVSPRYSWDVQTHDGGMGLEGVLYASRGKLRGILNGIDYRIWNPAADPLIPAPYSAQDLAGKATCREELLRTCGWSAEGGPLLVFIGRLVEQKGIDLILASLDRLLAEGNRVVLIGSGHPLFRDRVSAAAQRHPGRMWTFTDFDERVAHQAYAGGDLLLMPSLFEPCGLSQLISMAYGTIPVARATGGLADTVIDADGSPDGTGFLFLDYDPGELIQAVRRAANAMGDPVRWGQIQQRAMTADFSWAQSARAYEDLYQDLLGYGPEEDFYREESP